MDATHDLGRTMTLMIISGYSPIQRCYPQCMTVSNTTTLVTDRGTKPNGFPSPFRCVFTFLTNPTPPTRDLVVTEVPMGMQHLGMNPITITINPITDSSPFEHPGGMTVSNTMALVTDHITKPKGFSFALC